MKNNLFIIPVLLLLVSCGSDKKNANGTFELKGTFSNSKGGETIYLEELSPTGKTMIDSLQLDEKGNFSFASFSPSPSFYRVKVNEANFAMLVMDSSQKISMTGDLKDLGNSYKVEGSADTKVFLELNDLGKKISTRMDSFNTAFQSAMQTLTDSLKKDSAYYKVFKPIGDRMMEEHQKKVAVIVENNTNSLAALAGLQSLDPDHYLDIYKKVYEGIKARYPKSKYLFGLKQNIDDFNKTKGGTKAPDFTLNTPEGKPLSLSSLRGQVVLIDFWASWCGPCRAENPNVVKMYNKYHGKGFEILGVSLDEKQDKWVQAIQKDKLTWKHVSDLKGWSSAAAKLYAVEAIPFSILIDKEGNILAKGLRGPELEKKLSEVLK